MKTIVHVNRQIIAFNKTHNCNLPVYTVKIGSKSAKPVYTYSVKFLGPSVCIDPRHNAQLKCGAHAWMETESPVELDGEYDWDYIQKLKQEILKKDIDNAA